MKYGKIVVDDESLNSIMAFRKKREPNDEVIDYEHKSFSGEEAPAGGWIKKLLNKGKDGIWGVVEWTEKARKMIEAKEYRYFSPVTLTRKTDGKVLGLLGGGLTNMPNILGMQPLTNKSVQKSEFVILNQIQTHKEEPKMKKLLALLGLAETATEDEASVALNNLITANQSAETVIAQNKATVEALGLKPDATASEITGTIMAMKQTHSQHGDLAGTVAELTNKLALRDAAEAVEVALHSGKITPAQKPWAIDYATKDLAAFQVFVNKAPVIVHTGEIVKDEQGTGSGQLDETELKVCKLFGNKPEDVLKHKAA
jgi:phage I-like protein